MIDPRLLLLHPDDDVLVVRRPLPPAEGLPSAGLPIGHKVARHAIVAGAPIRKYGVPIGVATADIQAGAHVHIHNLRSGYTPTYTLDAARRAAANEELTP